MTCEGCGSDQATVFRFSGGIWSCSECGGVKMPWIPDVFFDGKPVETLNGKTFTSKRQKAEYLRKNDLSEIGDRVRGSRDDSFRYQPPKRNIRADREKMRAVFDKALRRHSA